MVRDFEIFLDVGLTWMLYLLAKMGGIAGTSRTVSHAHLLPPVRCSPLKVKFRADSLTFSETQCSFG